MIVSVVIPTLNEEKTIVDVIEEVKENKDLNLEIIVVDGNSEDKTRALAKKCGVDKIIIQKNLGYGLAYRTGFRAANGDIIIMIDADKTYPAYKITEMVNLIENDNIDMVLGSRFLGRLEKNSMDIVNLFGNIFITKMVNLFYLMCVSDSQSGLRAIKKESINKMKFNEIGMPFATELLIQAKKNKFKLKEIPIIYRRRDGGAPKLIAAKDGINIIKTILKNFIKRK